jgi:hypothetical protein
MIATRVATTRSDTRRRSVDQSMSKQLQDDGENTGTALDCSEVFANLSTESIRITAVNPAQILPSRTTVASVLTHAVTAHPMTSRRVPSNLLARLGMKVRLMLVESIGKIQKKTIH